MSSGVMSDATAICCLHCNSGCICAAVGADKCQSDNGHEVSCSECHLTSCSFCQHFAQKCFTCLLLPWIVTSCGGVWSHPSGLLKA